MTSQGQVDELLDLARDRSIEARMTLVDVIGDIFSERAPVLSDRERALISDILEKLVGEFEMTVRRELAQRLADKPAAPEDLVAMLANDEIEVARPILMQSQVLRDPQLIEIVRHRSRQHQLAVAVRYRVNAAVADALIDTGDDDVIRTLLKNENARLSEATLAYLVDQAQRRDSFLEPLVERRDLGDALARRLCWFVSAALRRRILERYDIDVADLDDAIEDAAHTVAADTDSADAPDDPAWALAQEIDAQRGITSAVLIKTLRGGEVRLFEALFGVLAGLRPPRLQHVLYETGGKGLALACRALEIDTAAFTSLYLLSRAARSGEQVADPRAVARLVDFFHRVDRDTAAKVLRSWQRDRAYQDAIDQIEIERRQSTAAVEGERPYASAC